MVVISDLFVDFRGIGIIVFFRRIQHIFEFLNVRFLKNRFTSLKVAEKNAKLLLLPQKAFQLVNHQPFPKSIPKIASPTFVPCSKKCK